MLKSYHGILNGDRIEWQGDAPQTSGPVAVDVSINEAPTRTRSDGKRMAEIAREIAKSGTFDAIKDPVEWQREMRRDRPLPFDEK